MGSSRQERSQGSQPQQSSQALPDQFSWLESCGAHTNPRDPKGPRHIMTRSKAIGPPAPSTAEQLSSK